MGKPNKSQNVVISLGLDEDLEEKLKWMFPDHGEFRVRSESIDARRGHSPLFHLQVEIANSGHSLPQIHFDLKKVPTPSFRPIIVGTGPCGLFAALRLAESGMPCLLIERGSRCEERLKRINRFWRYGTLDPNDNVCFGEGGAGLYSDGKLTTRIKSPHIPYVMDRLVKMGAPREILWLANPHVGSDRIRRLIPILRKYLEGLGCTFHFNTQYLCLKTKGERVDGIEVQDTRSLLKSTLSSPVVILATGHSAQDVYFGLHREGVAMEGKSFAMGLRVEHLQDHINQIQYREFAQHPKLKAAPYRLTHHDHQNQIGVYSFCMCPGGYVLSSTTEADGVVSNGMSNFRRSGKFANSAVVVSLDHKSLFGKDLLGGLHFRSMLEKRAHLLVKSQGGQQQLPAMRLMDFLSPPKSVSKLQPLFENSSLSGAILSPLHEVLPDLLHQNLIKGIRNFEKKMKGFVHIDSTVFGIESRTSSPLRILRDPVSFESPSHHGLFPAGEGAGYAGGITSAACDGVRIAEQILAGLA